MKNWPVGVKLAFGFGVLVLISALVGYAGWSGLRNVARKTQIADAASRLIQDSLEAGAAARDYMINKEAKSLERALGLVQHAQPNCAALAAALDRAEDVSQAEVVTRQFDAWQVQLRRYAELEEEKKQADLTMIATGTRCAGADRRHAGRSKIEANGGGESGQGRGGATDRQRRRRGEAGSAYCGRRAARRRTTSCAAKRST